MRMSQWDLFNQPDDDLVPCHCGRRVEPPVFARPHTPERLEACLVEARFGVTNHAETASHLDQHFERRGAGWVDEVMINGRPWPRALLWLSPPDRLHVE